MPFQNLPHWKTKHPGLWRTAVILGPTAFTHATLKHSKSRLKISSCYCTGFCVCLPRSLGKEALISVVISDLERGVSERPRRGKAFCHGSSPLTGSPGPPRGLSLPAALQLRDCSGSPLVPGPRPWRARRPLSPRRDGRGAAGHCGAEEAGGDCASAVHAGIGAGGTRRPSAG